MLIRQSNLGYRHIIFGLASILFFIIMMVSFSSISNAAPGHELTEPPETEKIQKSGKKTEAEIRTYLNQVKQRLDDGEDNNPIKRRLQNSEENNYSAQKRFGYGLHIMKEIIDHERSENAISPVGEKTNAEELIKLARHIQESNVAMEEDFARIENKCREAGLSETVLNRHVRMVDNYRKNTRNILKAIEQLENAVQSGGKREETTAKEKLSTLLKNFEVIKEPVRLQDGFPYSFEFEDAPTLLQTEDASLTSDNALSLEAENDEAFVRTSSTGAPTSEDLQPTVDVQLTQEIVDLATSLDNDPLKIYRYVYNNYDFEPYTGSRKGSRETFLQKRGNDYDICSLLIALLRASGVPARYVSGTVEMPVDQAKNWIGVDDGATAGSILTTVGMEGVNIINNEAEVVSIRFKHVWVEAFFAYAKYRGIKTDETGKMWIPLDPSVKQYQIEPGIDIPTEMGFDAQAFIANYISTYHSLSPVELFSQDVENYMATHYPELSLEDAIQTRSIVEDPIEFIPGSLPFQILSVEGDFSLVPSSMRYTVRFHLYNGGTTFIDHAVDLPAVAGKRITISYEAATEDDQETIDSFGDLYQTPPYLVSLRPLLKIDGNIAASGAAVIGMGLTHQSDMYFAAPTGVSNQMPTVSNSITAGTYQGIGISTGNIVAPEVFIPGENEAIPDTDGFTGQKLWRTAMGYLDRVQRHDDMASDLMQILVTRDVNEAIVENAVLVTYSFGTPQTFEWRGLIVDADRNIVGPFRTDGDSTYTKPFMILTGADGSVSENRIFEDEFGEEAVSTIKILELSSDLGIPIYTFNISNIGTLYSTLNLSSGTESVIYSAVSGGREVTVPRDNITYGEWYGTGYIDMDPSTGAAGYIISGGHSGGATVDQWTSLKMFIFTIFRKINSVSAVITHPASDGQFFPLVHPWLCGCPEKLYFEVDYTIYYANNSSRPVHEVYTPHFKYPLGDYTFHAGYDSGATRTFTISEVSATGMPDEVCAGQDKTFSMSTSPNSPTIGDPTFSISEGRLTIAGSSNPFTMTGVTGHADPDSVTAEWECCWGETIHEVHVFPEHVIGIPGLWATRYGEHEFLVNECPDHSLQDTTLDFEIDGCSNSPDSFESNVIETKYMSDFDLYVSEPVWGSDVGDVAHGNASQQTLPCNLHDICYQTCERSQASCDTDLRNNMESVCGASYPPVIPSTIPVGRWLEYMDERADCMDAASFYHTVLSSAGGWAWTLRQNEHCYCCKGN